MKKIFLISIVSIVLTGIFACGESVKKPAPPLNGVPQYEGDSVNFIKRTYKDGVLVSEEPFVNNRMHGVAKHYYSNGNLRDTIVYKEAKRHGTMASYYDTGEKHGDVTYLDGKIHGTRHNYKKDGSPTMVCTYEKGKPVPPLEEYDAAGQKIKQPTIKFSTSGGVLKMELSDRTYTSASFYRIVKGELIEIPTDKGVGRLPGAVKGTQIRAYYKSPRGAEGAVDAKY
ncbi:MAG: hypothetical protein LBQ01_08445 [Prevotellaceae bacterium]|jgi:hypothetical protein|nr:hypothetical protein [Prevotellaceae bacterium]